MNWKHWLARQSRRPDGIIGRYFMGRYLDRSNRQINEMAYTALAARPDQRILEVGFGGGELLFRIARGLERGQVDGVELSTTMIDTAQRRARKHGLRQLRVHHAGVDSLPFAAATFDLACSVHTVYFWPDLDQGMAELARVIKPGGRLVLGFSSAAELRGEGWVERGFMAYDDERIAAALRAQGFEHETLMEAERRGGGSVIVLQGVRQ